MKAMTVGMLFLMLGIAAADSTRIVIPALLMAVGVALMFLGGKYEGVI